MNKPQSAINKSSPEQRAKDAQRAGDASQAKSAPGRSAKKPAVRKSAVQSEVGPGLRIGITIGLRETGESLWINGIKQNALYLAKMFMQSPRGHQVTLVNTTPVSLDGVSWDRMAFPTEALNTMLDRLDVLIELGGQIGAPETAYLKRRGTRIVSYCCGPEYLQNTEVMLFDPKGGEGILINQHYDEIWVIPQIVESSWHFFSTLRRQPVRAVPFVWDPMCLEERARHLPAGGLYRPQGGARRLTVMEPNRDVFKFCLYPMLIADCAYRQIGDAIGLLQVTNSEHLAVGSNMFISIAQSLDLVKDRRACFVGRFDTPQFLSEYTDIVISHQWALALNYFYLDVCWMGYALVHNAHLCKELGYYYPENNVEEGARQLVEAIRLHDKDWEGYRTRQRELIGRFLATNPEVVATYDELLDQLCVRSGEPSVAE